MIEFLNTIPNSRIVKRVILGNQQLIKVAILSSSIYHEVNDINYRYLSELQTILDEFNFLATNIDENKGVATKRLKDIFKILMEQTSFLWTN